MSLREKLLCELEKARASGSAISGEEIAGKLGVSRVAVWKAVQKLTEEGWEILPVKGSGYLPGRPLEVLSEGRIRALLPPGSEDLPVYVYQSTSSTNDRAKEAAGKGVQRALFVAESQSAGRGRLGRSFYSPGGTGVYFTYLFSSERPLDELFAVTPCAAVAAARAIGEFTGKTVGIKWVNDLYLENRKVCGILTEAITSLESGRENRIAVGIGVNLTTGDFPAELAGKAGALGVMPDRCALVARIVGYLAAFERDPGDRGFMEEYTARSTVLHKTVELDRWGERIIGKVAGFSRDGGLVLETENGETRTFTGGEISLTLV